jgi:hypothetical protein
LNTKEAEVELSEGSLEVDSPTDVTEEKLPVGSGNIKIDERKIVPERQEVDVRDDVGVIPDPILVVKIANTTHLAAEEKIPTEGEMDNLKGDTILIQIEITDTCRRQNIPGETSCVSECCTPEADIIS